MSERVRFLLNGNLVEVDGISPHTTLLEYLRECAHLTGTKEGCAEGDCGACTVILTDASGDGVLSYRPINACIRFLPTVDGKAVYTVESLQDADGALHPVQQAMVDCHGSQCGFCTPGFVMSLFGLYKAAYRPSAGEIRDALSGNLCRCTGYRPIIAAADAMYDLPAPADWRGPGVAADSSRRVARDEEMTAASIAALARDATFQYEGSGRRFLAPTTMDELALLVAANPRARILAGGTDIGLWVTKEHRDLPDLIYVGGVRELAAVRESEDTLDIGAAASLTDAFAALDAEWPELTEAWRRFASVPIRNAGTLGGNVANGSPIGDAMPALIALAATVVLRHADCARELPLEDFYTGYRQTACAPGEFVAAIRVPRRAATHAATTLLRAYKVSRRFDQDISAVFVCIRLDFVGDRIVRARIGCGGVAATPMRARATETLLAGKRWDRATASAAAAALAGEFAPITDMRATADYRREMLATLFERCWYETGTDRDGVRAPTRVFELSA
jgi:xanthine dehydrogenase small subunit